ncbi:MAG: glycosyltransferase [Euryarchaeota archaeon]|nr:glycosyltransferase [Euryarchaeota archaeon]|tara:strand:+ start:19832 stop:20899 length:1068 start_codon:yes stop_codon:yes gene_type:complete
MRILLFGDFSGIHKNLQEGLQELGYQSTLVSSGDGYKNLPSDISFSYDASKVFGHIYGRLKPFVFLPIFKGYDIVQLISPYYLRYKYFPASFYYYLLRKFNKKFFTAAAGMDPYFWRYGRLKMKYGPFDDFLKYDLNQKFCKFQLPDEFIFNEKIVSFSNGIIADCYEYGLSYEGHPNYKGYIPLPVNISKIKYQDNVPGKKLKIFHGLTRYGYKGTRHVEKAFEILSAKYPNQLDLKIDGRMPQNEYLKLVRDSNIVIDQTNSYGLGINGVSALAMGKIVLGGSEPEDLKAIGVENSPVINIIPNHKSIVNAIESLLIRKKEIQRIGYESRKYTEKVHSHLIVAKKYLSIWNSN